MQHEMLFVNPVFNEEGLNVTVRAGDKWINTVRVGDKLLCKETGSDEVICEATIVTRAEMPCDLIPKEWLALEHDPGCMDYDGLFRTMKKIYPNFTQDSPVTVLIFKI